MAGETRSPCPAAVTGIAAHDVLDSHPELPREINKAHDAGESSSVIGHGRAADVVPEEQISSLVHRHVRGKHKDILRHDFVWPASSHRFAARFLISISNASFGSLSGPRNIELR